MQINANTNVHVHDLKLSGDDAACITSVFIIATKRGYAVIDFHMAPDVHALSLFMHDPDSLESLGHQALALAEEMRNHRELNLARAATKGA